MKLFGSLTELVAAVFRKNSQAITLRPSQTTTYTASRDVQLPPADSDQVLVGDTATQTLTNKTFTSPTITGGSVSNTTTINAKDTLFTIQDDGDTSKQARFQASGITTATIRTFTFPNADTTLVGTAITQTIQNKTFDTTNSMDILDNAFQIKDNGDPTKIAQFQASAITTGTTRTYVLPDANVNLVGSNNAETIQNKTLDNSNTITVKDNLFTIQGSADTTKQAVFEVDTNIPTATTRTFTFPNANTTLVGTGATQTLTNKTLSLDTVSDALNFTEQSAQPTTPAAATLAIYSRTTTEDLAYLNSAGTAKVIADLTSSQVFTGKDIDGGTASNTSRITLPKAATATLNGLTRKQATLVYDTTTDQVKFDNGTTLSALATTSVATPTAQGTTTSYFATIQSATSAVTNANATSTTTDGFLAYLFSTGNTGRTLTLPAASANNGRTLQVKKTDSGTGTVTITRAGSDTIDGATTYVLTSQYDSVTLTCDGSATWNVITAPLATTTVAGAMSTGTQTMAGSKTWNDIQTFKASSGTQAAGNYTANGKWTIGDNTVSSLPHACLGTSANGGESIFETKNNDTTTSSDATYGLLIIKGSTTNTTAQRYVRFQINAGGTNAGQINANGADAAAFGATSDSRLKTNIQDLPSQLDNIMALRPVTYDRTDMAATNQIGFIAQEIQAVYPDTVCERPEDGMLVLTGWSKTEARLVKALQELKEQFDAYVQAHP